VERDLPTHLPELIGLDVRVSAGGSQGVDGLLKAALPGRDAGGAPPRRKGNTRKKAVPYGLASPGVLWLVIFFVVPSIFMLLVSLSSGTLGTLRFSWKWSNYSTMLSLYDRIYIRSLVYALIVALVTLTVAYPVAYWISFYGGKRKNVYLLLLLLPFFVSFVLRTVQFQFIFSGNGPVVGTLKNLHLVGPSFHLLSTPAAVIAGISYNFLPFTALPLYVSLERIEPQLLEAGRDLYANRWTTFLRVVWPLSIPGVFAAFLLTFVPAVGDYVNASLLGGRGTTMIGNIIQTQFLTNFDYPHGAALSFILMLVLLIGAALYSRALGTEAVLDSAGR
jgi:spermidine/putrescine transport system permease protein